MNTLKSRYTLLAALLAVPGLAQAVSEHEANNPIAVGETVEITVGAGAATGGATIAGIVGNPTGALLDDLDFFVFSGREGDVVTLDIDNGAGDGTGKSVDTIMAIYGAGNVVLRQNDDIPGGTAIDTGSRS